MKPSKQSVIYGNNICNSQACNTLDTTRIGARFNINLYIQLQEFPLWRQDNCSLSNGNPYNSHSLYMETAPLSLDTHWYASIRQRHHDCCRWPGTKWNQSISNHHADFTLIIISCESYYAIRIAFIKQTVFDGGRGSATRQFLCYWWVRFLTVIMTHAVFWTTITRQLGRDKFLLDHTEVRGLYLYK